MRFLEIIKGKSIEEIYALPDLEEQLATLASEIEALDPQTRVNVEEILQKLSHYVGDQMINPRSEMEQGRAKIDRVRQNSDACIAYLQRQKD